MADQPPPSGDPPPSGGLPQTGEDEVHPPSPPGLGFTALAGQGPAFGAVAVGGALGSLARYGLALALPTATGAFPLATFLTNVAGGLAIGVLVVALTELSIPHRLLRPFLVTGILGGFTTFSTYAVDVEHLLAAGRVGTALAYLIGTLASALAATWLGITLTRGLGAAAGRAGAAR